MNPVWRIFVLAVVVLNAASAFADPCLAEWYYAKGKSSTQWSGPYKGCQDVPDSIDGGYSKPWCATQAAYFQNQQYGTNFEYCGPTSNPTDPYASTPAASKCVKGPWLFANDQGYDPGPYIGCANPDNDPKGAWCATKVVYVSQNLGGTQWQDCTLASTSLYPQIGVVFNNSSGVLVGLSKLVNDIDRYLVSLDPANGQVTTISAPIKFPSDTFFVMGTSAYDENNRVYYFMMSQNLFGYFSTHVYVGISVVSGDIQYIYTPSQ